MGGDDEPKDSARRSGPDSVEPATPLRQPFSRSNEQHFRPTVPAPNVPLPPAALQPQPVPRPARMPSLLDGPLPPARTAAAVAQPAKRPTAPPTRRPTGAPTVRPDRRSGLRPRPAGDEPSVLLVGAPDALAAALEPALARHHVHVERAAGEEAADFVLEAAPDLVLLAGDAASDTGHHVLRTLASSPQTSVVPVAILDDNTELEVRLRAFRHGAAAVIPRSASIDAIASRVATLAREIPEREGETLGDVGEATLQDFVSALGKELRTGILSVRASGASDSEAIRIVLGGGRALSETIDEFVARVREHVVEAEPLRYEFDERATGTIELLGAAAESKTSEQENVDGLRVVLADDDAARADAVSRELRDRGVDVVVTDLEPSDVRFHRRRTTDPTILLIGDQQSRGPGYELMRRMRRDVRLRWASLLVVRWQEVWAEQSAVPAIERIIGTLAALAEPERSLCERAESSVAYDTRLEITGAARLLRALSMATRPVRVTVQNPRLRVRVDVSEGLIVGAMGETLGPEPRELTGPAALAALMVVSSGRVHVEPTEQPAVANVMATPDVALNLADAEPPPIPPSMPIPAPHAAEHAHATAQPSAGSKRRGGGMGAPILYGLAALGAVVVAGTLAVVAIRAAGGDGSHAAAVASQARPAPPGSAEPSPPVAATRAPGKPAATNDDRSATATPTSLTPEQADALAEAPSCEKLLVGIPPNPGIYPGAAYAQLKVARKALVRGDLDAAQAAFCHALRFDPKNHDVMAGLARLLLIRRDGAAAVQWSREAVKARPEEKSLQLLLGDALALGGDPERAAEPLLLGSGIPTGDDAARKKLAAAQLGLASDAGRRQDAHAVERFHRRAWVLDPTNATAAAGVARALLDQGHAKASLHWARRATTLDPRSASCFVVLGDALSKSGDTSGAAKAWKQATELDPNDATARTRAMTAP